MKLLIAEDDVTTRTLIAMTVPDSWTVLEAIDGIEALALAREHEPDAIILDHHMPVLCGAEVADLLREEHWRRDCCIIALTADQDVGVRREMTLAGVDAFLIKPFSPIELLDLLAERHLFRV